MTPVALALKIANDALEMPEWNQDEMILALVNIARLLTAVEAMESLEASERMPA